MAGLDAITGLVPSAPSAAESAEPARPADELARLTTARAAEPNGFELLFAALLGNATPAPVADAGTDGASSDVSTDAGDVDADADARLFGTRTAESAAYAAVRAGRGAYGDASAIDPAVGHPALRATADRPSAAVVAAALSNRMTTSAEAPTDTAATDGATTTPGTASPGPVDVAATPAALDAAHAAMSLPAPAAPAPSVPPVATSSHDEALASVDPALRDKLERVVDRMQREFGHDVRVVEGRRSQARQDALFAQGRTAPGPVVTWTRDSAHLDGHAVDVMIDGGYDNAKAFRTLARIARQEGLKTLGPRDPGHLELADDAAAASAAGGNAGVAGVAPVATVASVARVAAVARPAAVAAPADVARVAVPGESVAASASPATPTPRVGDDTAASRPVEETRTRLAPREAARDTMRERVEELAARLSPSLATGGRPDAQVEATVGLPGVDLAARLEAVARVRDAQASQPLSRLVMDVPDTIGGVDRIAVSLRGQRVDASLAIQDPATAARAAQRVEALVEALGARGYDAGTLAVSAARGIAPESLDLTRLSGLALEREGTRGVASFLQDVSGGGLRDRQHSPGRQHDSHASSRGDDGSRGDTPRRQPRRNPGDRE